MHRFVVRLNPPVSTLLKVRSHIIGQTPGNTADSEEMVWFLSFPAEYAYHTHYSHKKEGVRLAVYASHPTNIEAIILRVQSVLLIGWLLARWFPASGWLPVGEQAGDVCRNLLAILIEHAPEAVLTSRLLEVVPLLRMPHHLVLLIGLDSKKRVDPLSLTFSYVKGAQRRH